MIFALKLSARNPVRVVAITAAFLWVEVALGLEQPPQPLDERAQLICSEPLSDACSALRAKLKSRFADGRATRQEMLALARIREFDLPNFFPNKDSSDEQANYVRERKAEIRDIYEHMLRLEPDDAEVLSRYALTYRGVLRLQLLSRAAMLEPENGQYEFLLAITLGVDDPKYSKLMRDAYEHEVDAGSKSFFASKLLEHFETAGEPSNREEFIYRLRNDIDLEGLTRLYGERRSSASSAAGRFHIDLEAMMHLCAKPVVAAFGVDPCEKEIDDFRKYLDDGALGDEAVKLLSVHYRRMHYIGAWPEARMIVETNALRRDN